MLVGDAFAADKKETKVHGKAITERHSMIAQQSLGENLESRNNIVSYMKPEPLVANCRNVVAVSDHFICYSIPKKSLIRVIQTPSSKKDLLRLVS